MGRQLFGCSLVLDQAGALLVGEARKGESVAFFEIWILFLRIV